jgi:hypothetical protein
MASRKMSRTAYRDPTVAGQPVRSGDTTHGESNLDVESYLQPLEQAHGSGPHGWGIAQGLRTTATIGAAGLTIEPGIAVDGTGRHVSLAPGTATDPSYAETATVDPPVPSVPAPVTAAGVTLPTATTPLLPAGDYYATVQWLEELDQAGLGSPTGAVWRFNHTPWLRLRPVAGFVDNGELLVLARVRLDPTGKVTALTHELRRAVGLPAQTVRLQAAGTTSSGGQASSAEADGGELRVRRDSTGTPAGMELVAAKPTDEIHLKGRSVDRVSTVAKIELSATTVTARNAAGVDTVTVSSPSGDVAAGGTVSAAARVVAPSLVARRADGRETVVVDAQPGDITAGTVGVDGNLRVSNAQGVEQVNIDGAGGHLWYRGNLRDPAASWHPGITHPQLRELVGGVYTNLHRHRNSGNTTSATAFWMFAANSTDIRTLTVPTRTRVLATICLTAVNPRAAFDQPDGLFAEIYRVDGNDFRQRWYSGGDHLGPDGADENMRQAFFLGTASSITFRLRSMQPDTSVWALALVFPEAL